MHPLENEPFCGVIRVTQNSVTSAMMILLRVVFIQTLLSRRRPVNGRAAKKESSVANDGFALKSVTVRTAGEFEKAQKVADEIVMEGEFADEIVLQLENETERDALVAVARTVILAA
jgi:hypothetical protein